MYQSMNLTGSSQRQGYIPQPTQQESSIQNSPSRVKISQLNDKLENLQYEIDESKQIKKETFETKIKLLGENITKSVESDESKFKLLKEQLIKIQEGISLHKESRDVLEESKTKQIKLVENKFVFETQKEKQIKTETDNQILKSIEEKNYQLKVELSRDRKIRQEEEESEAQRVNDEVNYLNEALDSEKSSRSNIFSLFQTQNYREQNSEELISKLGDDVLKLQEMLNYEKKAREENQNNLYNMLQEMDSQLNFMITNEKKGRENNEEMLLRLLEDCCGKMEISIHH